MKYKTRSTIVDAVQWFKLGDHEEVKPYSPDYPNLGYLSTDIGWCVVSPGDWIVTTETGIVYRCKSSVFNATYEKVDDHEQIKV